MAKYGVVTEELFVIKHTAKNPVFPLPISIFPVFGEEFGLKVLEPISHPIALLVVM